MSDYAEAREVAALYNDYAGRLREHLPGVCNWFDFASWGTYNVTLLMEVVGEPLAAVLRDGQRAILADVIGQANRFLAGRPASRGVVGEAVTAYYQGQVEWGNLILATREQELVDPVWQKVLDEMGPEFASRMIVVWPNDVLYPPQPYQDFDVRMPWIEGVMSEHLHNELLWTSPVEVAERTWILT